MKGSYFYLFCWHIVTELYVISITIFKTKIFKDWWEKRMNCTVMFVTFLYVKEKNREWKRQSSWYLYEGDEVYLNNKACSFPFEQFLNLRINFTFRMKWYYYFVIHLEAMIKIRKNKLTYSIDWNSVEILSRKQIRMAHHSILLRDFTRYETILKFCLMHLIQKRRTFQKAL